MSHHFDYPQDPTLDIADAFCFAGVADDEPRTVFGVTTSPMEGKPWNSTAYYELKIDTNGDLVEDITYRATFPIASDGTQHVRVELLTGAAAADRTASGTVITPPDCPVGEVVELGHGIKLFAGPRRDPFYNFIPFPVAIAKAVADRKFPDLQALLPAKNDFANTTIRCFEVEVPASITGRGKLNFWATSSYFDTGHNTWVQVQRAAEPNMSSFFDFTNGLAHLDYSASVPTIDLVGRPANPATDPASGVWGQVRDDIAAIVEDGKTYDSGPHSFPTALAYAAWAADTLLPNVITFTPGTVARWDAWHGFLNGKGVVEDIGSNIIKMMLNQDVSTGLTPGPVLDHFPYLTEPPAGH